MKNRTVVGSGNWIIPTIALLLISGGCQRLMKSPKMQEIAITWDQDQVNTGLIISTLAHTEIPSKYSLKLDFKGITNQVDVNKALVDEAAIGGIFTLEKCIELISQDTTWTLVARIAREPIKNVNPTDSSSALTDSIGELVVKPDKDEFTVLAIRNMFIRHSPAKVVDILEAFLNAGFYVARNQEEVREWYRRDFNAQISLDSIKIIGEVNANHRAMMKSHILLNLSIPDQERLQRTIEMRYQEGLVKEPFAIQSRIDLNYLRQAERKWWDSPDEP
jgi:hypothetical protein